MEGFLNKVKNLSQFTRIIGGISLTFLMFLTVIDVILRLFKRPIVGTYEMVFLTGAIAIGFSIPFTTWVRGHIYLDFLISRFSSKTRNIFNIITRCLGICLFLMLGWNLIEFGWYLYKTGEVSSTLQLPYYPVAYGVGASCLFQCLVLFSDILKIIGGKYE